MLHPRDDSIVLPAFLETNQYTHLYVYASCPDTRIYLNNIYCCVMTGFSRMKNIIIYERRGGGACRTVLRRVENFNNLFVLPLLFLRPKPRPPPPQFLQRFSVVNITSQMLRSMSHFPALRDICNPTER